MTTTAQEVCLSEIRADNGGSWIELHNRSAATADLSNWSLHYVTTTTFMPRTYWWPFPPGSTIDPGGFLRVHWYVDGPSSPPAGEIYSGTSVYGYLFGLGAEPLWASEGALGLLSSQSNTAMNTASTIVDWISWGSSGHQREAMAVAAGVWTTGRATASLPIGGSLARNLSEIGAPGSTPDEAWFYDFTPTPGEPNVNGALVETFGDPCTLPGNHLIGPPSLTANGLPLYGNQEFGLRVQNTTGIYAEFVLVGFSTGAAPTGLPSILPEYSGIGCQEIIDTQSLVGTWLLPSSLLESAIALPLNGLSPQVIGAELYAQALVIELLPTAYPPYQGLTNAVRIIVGQ
ncbi:MAG: lamin tail domain-containing protein [Planctomycetota bacterium]